MTEEELIEVGRRVRDRRRELGLSLRELSAAADISPSYLGSIEGARNPTTGRAPAPSVRVLTGIAGGLGIELRNLLEEAGPRADDHVLLFALGPARNEMLSHVAGLYVGAIDHWIYISDPRGPVPVGAAEAGITRVSWPFGEEPYPTRFLEPARIASSLKDELKRAGPLDGRVGIAICDCSAVMRWVHNPEAEVAYEDVWADQARAAMEETLGRSPAANVCVYHQADLEALGLTVDLLDVTLRLLRSHEATAALDRHDRILTGDEAVRAILGEARPHGVSFDAWEQLVSAASPALSGR